MRNLHLRQDGGRPQPTICDSACLKSAASTVPLIFLYFSLSIGLTFYQRWLLQTLRFPLFVTSVHLIVKFLLASFFRCVYQCFYRKPRVSLSWSNYTKKLAPVGLSGGFDVGFSNWGLELVTISLYTMTKSTAIIFILIFSLFFNLERKSWRIVVIVLMISSGLLMFTYKATQFNWLGFFLLILATFSSYNRIPIETKNIGVTSVAERFLDEEPLPWLEIKFWSHASGLRWTLAQLLMQKSKLGLENPIDMVYHVQPWMLVMVFPFAVAIEGPNVVASCKVFNFNDWPDLWRTVWTVLFGACTAFFMELAEYLVVSTTSSLTLSIVGIFKDVCTLVLAIALTKDQVSPINMIGLLTCLGGITLHVFSKALASSSQPETSDSEELILTLHGDPGEQRTPLLAGGSEDSILLSDSDSNVEASNVIHSVVQRRSNSAYDLEGR